MPVATRNNQQNGSERNNAPSGRGQETPAVVVPFVRASDEHLQPSSIDATRTVTGSQQDLGIFDVPSYGYIRWLYLLVTATNGDAGLATVAAAEDAPFNVLQNIALTEPNGAYIVQFTDGWQAFLAQKYGGYLPPYSADPRATPIFSDVDADGDFTFLVRVPIELSGRDGLGSLPNQDSAGQFKLRVSFAGSGTIYDTAPDTLPDVRLQAWLSAWDQPEPTSGGVGNQVQPPAVGTTGFWSVQSGIPVSAGENTIELKRKGNYLRTVVFVFRRSGSRSDGESDWPAETRFLRDAFPARYYDDRIWRNIMFERSGFAAANEAASGLDNGVRVHDYMHEFDGGYGRENRDLWQPTRGSTRLELAGNFSNAGTLDVITHDVAIAQDVFL